MKGIKLIIIVIGVISFTTSLEAQEKFEIGAKICLQTPKFWNGSFMDVTTARFRRYRPAFGVYTKYHLNKVFFAEYDLDFSWEGGGFDKRRTNLTFVKNTLFIGVSTNVYKANSFNFKIGAAQNTLLSAKMDDRFNDTKSNVSQYFNTSSLSFPFSVGYVRKINESYTIGLNTYFQILSGPLSTQKHIGYTQTLQRLEIKVSKFIDGKDN